MKSAAICKSGHVVSIDVIDPPNRSEQPAGNQPAPEAFSMDIDWSVTTPRIREVQKFCGTCGAPVITACGSCGAGIPSPDFAFCVNCGEPFPWASREQLISKLESFLDFEDGLSPADRLEAVEQIAVLSELEEADEPGTIDRRVGVAARIRRLAPGAWTLAQPILTTVLSSEVQQGLQRLH